MPCDEREPAATSESSSEPTYDPPYASAKFFSLWLFNCAKLLAAVAAFVIWAHHHQPQTLSSPLAATATHVEHLYVRPVMDGVGGADVEIVQCVRVPEEGVTKEQGCAPEPRQYGMARPEGAYSLPSGKPSRRANAPSQITEPLSAMPAGSVASIGSIGNTVPLDKGGM